jgi:hypothetical protein
MKFPNVQLLYYQVQIIQRQSPCEPADTYPAISSEANRQRVYHIV